MPTPVQTILYAKISQFLASADVAKGNLYGEPLDVRLPKMLYAERVILEKIYNANNNYDDIQVVSDYVYALCGKYVWLAQALSGGGQVVTPTGYTPFVYLIPIQSSDFSDATHYYDTRIVGKNLEIFWNNINRYLNTPSDDPPEFEYVTGGINILAPGFDATQFADYELKIYIKNPI